MFQGVTISSTVVVIASTIVFHMFFVQFEEKMFLGGPHIFISSFFVVVICQWREEYDFQMLLVPWFLLLPNAT